MLLVLGIAVLAAFFSLLSQKLWHFALESQKEVHATDLAQSYQCQLGNYSIEVLHRDPLILFIRNFLKPGEGEYFKNVSAPMMKRSSVAESADNYYAESNVRTSSSAFLMKGQDEVVKCVEERASRLTGIPLDDCEPLQVVWYTKGQLYRPHHDVCFPGYLTHNADL